MNARRHGLATPISDIPEQSSRLERLAALLAEDNNHLLVAEEPRLIAECHLDMQRIRAIQHEMLREMIEADTIEGQKSSVSEIEKIDRYRRRAVSRRKAAFRRLFLSVESLRILELGRGARDRLAIWQNEPKVR